MTERGKYGLAPSPRPYLLDSGEIMYLPAITIGYTVPGGNFDASVHSAFKSALNFSLSAGGELLTLVISSEADLPQGIRLDTPAEFSFEIFHPGEPVTCQDGFLRLGALTIELGSARRWKCDLSRLEIDITNPAVSAAWSLVWDALNRRQKNLNAEIIAEDLFRPDKTARTRVSFTAGKVMRALVDATQRFDLAGISAVQTLIGLGSGLTPSGDDLLAGYIAGLWCTVSEKSDRAQFIAGFGKKIVQLSHLTNDISRTYLFHAAHGQVSSRLAMLAEEISRERKPEYILEAAESAIQIGNTSGMDAVTGLLVGISAWSAKKQELL
jgi:hypothetical protein